MDETGASRRLRPRPRLLPQALEYGVHASVIQAQNYS
jgi:hypothetical protein